MFHSSSNLAMEMFLRKATRPCRVITTAPKKPEPEEVPAPSPSVPPALDKRPLPEDAAVSARARAVSILKRRRSSTSRPKKTVRWNLPSENVVGHLLSEMQFPPGYARKVRPTLEPPKPPGQVFTAPQPALRKEKTPRASPFPNHPVHRLWKLPPGTYKLLDVKERTALLLVGKTAVVTPLPTACPLPPVPLPGLYLKIEGPPEGQHHLRVSASWIRA